MAELTSQERLQPSLLDRLTDDDPRNSREAAEARVLTRTQLRAAVLRDLAFLLNAARLEPAPQEEDTDEVRLWRENPEARRSTLNFGLPPLSGRVLTVVDFGDIETMVREAIVAFEPRLDPATLSVEIESEAAARAGVLKLRIRGQMWSQPAPLDLLLSAEVDVETGQSTVRDQRR